MNDAQTWTVIGGFLAILTFGMGLVLRTVSVEIRAVSSVLSIRLDAIDRDVQRLYEREFGQDR